MKKVVLKTQYSIEDKILFKITHYLITSTTCMLWPSRHPLMADCVAAEAEKYLEEMDDPDCAHMTGHHRAIGCLRSGLRVTRP